MDQEQIREFENTDVYRNAVILSNDDLLDGDERSLIRYLIDFSTLGGRYECYSSDDEFFGDAWKIIETISRKHHRD